MRRTEFFIPSGVDLEHTKKYFKNLNDAVLE